MTENPTPSIQATPSNNKVPVSVITGFLGSGKTTIISHLIDDLQSQGIQVAYLKNEVGSDTVDKDLLEGKNIYTKELLNGCICCTLVGNFHQALTEIAQTIRPDRIIIESSGVSDPTAIALTLNAHPDVLRDTVLSIIDVVNFEGIPELEKARTKESSFTDVIVFNKVEQVDDDRKRQVVGYVREFNTHAPIIEAPHGRVHPEMALGFHSVDQEKLLTLSAKAHTHDHLDEENIHTFSFSSQESFDQPRLLELLHRLPRTVFRIKGYISLRPKPSDPPTLRILNGVNGQFEFTSPSSSPQSSNTHLIFIGFRIAELEQQIKTDLAKISTLVFNE